MGERIYARVSFVILPVDAFSGRVITDPKFEIRAEGERRPLRKPEGFWIFTHLAGERTTVILRGGAYQEMRAVIWHGSLKANHPVLRIYMLPDRNYAFPADTAYLEGTLPEHSVLMAAGIYGTGIRKLGADCEIGDGSLLIYQGEETDMTGQVYRMEDARQGHFEWIMLTAKLGLMGGDYRLGQPLQHSYQKVRTSLYPALLHETDRLGSSFFIAFRGNAKGGSVPVHCRIVRDDAEENYEILLKCKEVLRRDF